MARNFPAVTVVMCTYNGEKFLRTSIESILNQSHRDFEFLLINDASTDSSADIINSYHDDRIRLITNDYNLGHINSANKGVSLARGKYVARLDHDDISPEYRLETELETFCRDDSLAICAGQYQNIDENGAIISGIKPPASTTRALEGDLLLWHQLFSNQVANSSAMIRKDALLEMGGYTDWAPLVEDFELFSRMIYKYKTVVIPEVLLFYRISSGQVTRVDGKSTFDMATSVIHRSHEELLETEVNIEYSRELRSLVKKHLYSTKNGIPRFTQHSMGAIDLLDKLKKCVINKRNLNIQSKKEITKMANKLTGLVFHGVARKHPCSVGTMSRMFLRNPSAVITETFNTIKRKKQSLAVRHGRAKPEADSPR